MYCKKCGKEIDYEAEVCNECVAAEAVDVEVAPAEAAVVASGKNPKVGLGKAITSLALPIIGMIVMGIIAGFISVIANDLYKSVKPYLENPEQMLATEAQVEQFLSILKNFIETDLIIVLIAAVLLLVAGAATFVMGIVGIILGIQSIKCFVNENKNNGNKPIPTLIIGILGLLESASAVISIAGTVAIIAAVVALILL